MPLPFHLESRIQAYARFANKPESSLFEDIGSAVMQEYRRSGEGIYTLCKTPGKSYKSIYEVLRVANGDYKKLKEYWSAYRVLIAHKGNNDSFEILESIGMASEVIATNLCRISAICIAARDTEMFKHI